VSGFRDQSVARKSDLAKPRIAMKSSPRPPTASFGAATALALGGFFSRPAEARTLKVLVFLHVALKQRAFEGELKAALPNLDVKAVGRLADFDRALEEGQDAVLSSPLLLAAHRLAVKLQGHHAGSSDERYSLVGAGAAPAPDRVAAIGALDLLGREATNGFVHGLLGAKPRVERVTKLEDLLPLLQMQKVDGILLPTRLLADVQASSRLALEPHQLPSPVKLPALAAIGPGGPEAVAAVARLPLKISRTLGVDEWR
jgi:hypothetical protein